MVESGHPESFAEGFARGMIPDPPAYTYSAEVYDPATRMSYRRRSDGQWEIGGTDYEWCASHRTDESVRALAACVPGLIPPKPVPTLWVVKDRTGAAFHTVLPRNSPESYWDKVRPDRAPHTVRAYAEVTE